MFDREEIAHAVEIQSRAHRPLRWVGEAKAEERVSARLREEAA